MGDFLDARLRQIRLTAIAAATLRQAEEEIESCEYCHEEEAEIPFDWLLAEVIRRWDAVEIHAD